MLLDLQLKWFRCFDALSVEFAPNFNFLVGANGEGKSSILEAVCVLLRLQSQRTSTLQPLIQLSRKAFLVAGHVADHALRFEYSGLRRTQEFDGVEQRTAAEYLRIARVVSFANVDIEIVRGSSEPRRRYLDFLGAQIEAQYRPTLRAYERVVRSRNMLLKFSPPKLRELAAYDAPLLEHGAKLTNLRTGLVQRLAPEVGAAHAAISGSKEKVEMLYARGHGSEFATDLERSRTEELRLRQTLVGPHRDDIELRVDEMSASSHASEGQQRTLALALKIAQARVLASEATAPPVLLIDDIFGELEPERRNALLVCLPGDSQKLVTATSLEWRRDVPDGVMFELKDRKLLRL